MQPEALDILTPTLTVIAWVTSAVMGVTALAGFVNALLHKSAAFTAAGKLNKLAWSAILFVCAAVIFLLRDPMRLFGVIAMIPTLLYWVDVRPALREVTRGSSW